MKNKTLKSVLIGAVVGACLALVAPVFAAGSVATFDYINRALFIASGSNPLVLGSTTGNTVIRVNGTDVLTAQGTGTPRIDVAARGQFNTVPGVTQVSTVSLTPVPLITPASVSVTVPATITPADLSGQLNSLGTAVNQIVDRLQRLRLVGPTPTP